NRISANFPGIPKITPQDGFFGSSTTDAVKKFQEVFDLTPDGVVGKSTWYRIQFIYNAVKKLASLNSEGLRLNDISTKFPSVLQLGDSSSGVLTVQYYLAYISTYIPSVLDTAVDGTFGEETRNSVLSFQKAYGLEETGVVNRAVWDEIENVYYSLLRVMPYEFSPGDPLPFPGRVLRIGIEGNDVRALQEYLNFIANSYPEIPKISVDGVYGQSTASAVSAFVNIFGRPGNPERVSAQDWNAIVNVYEDLYRGAEVNSGQYPGYDISSGG
ncbi:MAG: peptidoglycan-binding protein, partial [Clostridia bacterium]|nr:peptidoglycan-binding protein [Clostridia bacterium]